LEWIIALDCEFPFEKLSTKRPARNNLIWISVINSFESIKLAPDIFLKNKMDSNLDSKLLDDDVKKDTSKITHSFLSEDPIQLSKLPK